MPLVNERRRILPLVLDKDLNRRHRYYDRGPRVLAHQRNATKVSRAVDRVRDREAEVDRDRLLRIIDATVATVIILIEAEGEEIATKIVALTEEWIGRIEVQLLLVFCKY